MIQGSGQDWASGKASPLGLKILLPLALGGNFTGYQAATQPGKVHGVPDALPVRWALQGQGLEMGLRNRLLWSWR